MPVSGEFKYFGPDFSSVARVLPVKAMILPASLAIGNMTRLRNLEYIRASGFRVWAWDNPSFRRALSLRAGEGQRGFCCSPAAPPPSPFSGTPDPEARTPSPCFHE